MIFNVGKCEWLHTGPVNTGMNYEMGGTIYTIHLRRSRDSFYSWIYLLVSLFVYLSVCLFVSHSLPLIRFCHL